jgi:O-antigen/teichoic acid export membrane protein
VIVMPTSLLLLGLLYFGAGVIANGIFHKPELIALVRILAWTVPLLGLQSLLASAIRARKAIKYTALIGAVQAVSALALAILFMALGLGLRGVAISYLLSQVLGTFLAVLFYVRVVPRHGRVRLYPIRAMLKFSVPLTLTKWIQFANERTEIIFLGLLPSAIYAGIYKIAWSLAGLETMLRLSLEDILAPFSSDLTHRKAIPQLDALYKTTAKWSFTWALLLASGYLLFGATLMGFIDPAYQVGTAVLIALAFAQLVNEATGACGTILIMSGRSDLSLFNTAVLFGLSATLDWILIPIYGLAGAAFVGSLAIVLVNTLRVVEVWALLKIHPFAWSFLKPAVAAVAAVAAIGGAQLVLPSGGVAALLLYGLAFLCIYLAVILLLRLDADDLLILRAMYRRFSGLLATIQGIT